MSKLHTTLTLIPLALKVLVDLLHLCLVLRQEHKIIRIHIIRVGQDRSNSAVDSRGFVVVLMGSGTLDFASSTDIHEADGICCGPGIATWCSTQGAVGSQQFAAIALSAGKGSDA